MVGAKKLPVECGAAPHYDNKCTADPTRASDGEDPKRSVPTWEEDSISEGSLSSQGDPIYTQIHVGTRHELVSELSICLETDSIYRIATGRQAPLDGPFDILIIRDPIHKPSETAVIPEVQTLEPGEDVFISIMCLDHPFWLTAGIPIVQAFLLPKDLPEKVPENPVVMWTQIMGTNKRIVKCTLFSREEKIRRKGMLDTRADMTLIARLRWPRLGPRTYHRFCIRHWGNDYLLVLQEKRHHYGP